MKLLILLSIVGVAVGRPSVGHHLVYSQDGRSFSYSYQTPFFQTLHPSARFYQTAPVFVTPHVKYSLETPPVAVKYAEPANIQLSHDGFVLDTPEVANARAEHLAAVAKEAARAGSSSENEIEPIVVPENDAIEVEAAPKQFEPANIQVSADGHVLDTPEVAQAKIDHLARFAVEAARSVHNVVYNPAYVGYNVVAPAPIVKSFADIKVSSDGHVLDTPEVAQARADHLARFAAEAARAEAAGDDQDQGNDVESEAQDDSVSVEASKTVNDPPADIKVSEDGFVLDTPEVAQAKAEHLAELAKVGSTEDDESDTGDVQATIPSYVAYTSPAIAYTAPVAYYQQKYYGPEADIKVGADGYVLDTPEVQQARAEHLALRNSIMATQGTRYASGQYIADTPEVVAARAAHLKAHAEEAAKTSQTFSYGQLVYRTPVFRTGIPAFGYSGHPYALLGFRYAPTVGPALTPDGQYLLDTPEVAAEKIKHFAAHARARGY